MRITRIGVTLVLLLGLLGLPAPAEATPEGFEFTGAGWGHGIGGSQYGMRGQADDGRGYTQILGHYYTGTRVEDRDPPAFVRVMLAADLTELRVEGNGHYEFHVAGSPVATTEGNDGQWRVRPTSDGRFDILRPDGSKAAGPVGSASDPVIVAYRPWNTIVRLPQTGRRYRWGLLELKPIGGGKLRVVASLVMEEYLRGIGEMPSSWPMEALKAQAVAARTYAAEKAFRLGHARPGCDCTVFGDTRDQAYIGYDKEDPATFGGSTSLAARWPNAVDATRDDVVTWNSSSGWRHAQTFYSSSSGGRTEENEDVWGGSPLPYLRSVDDHWSQRSSNPFASWTVSYGQADVAARLGMGRVEAIDVSSRTTGGGVAEARVFGDVNKTFTGDRFRSLMGLRSIKFDVEAIGAANVWSGWRHVGARHIRSTEDPTLAAAPNSAVHAVFIGTDETPYASRRDPGTGDWSPWQVVGPQHSAGFVPDVTVAPDGRVHVVMRGRTHPAIWHAVREPSTGAWHGWTHIGHQGSRGHEPEVAAAPDGSVWVVVQGFDDAAWASRWSPASRAWSGWRAVGRDALQPDIAVAEDGTVYVIARGAENRHVKVARNIGGAWGAFERVGTGAESGTDPVLAARSDGSVLAGLRGNAGHLYFSRITRTGWTHWVRVGAVHDRTGEGAGPRVAADPSGAVHMLIRGRSSNAIYTSMQPSPGAGWSRWTRVGESHDHTGPRAEIPATGAPNGLVHGLIRGGDQRVYTAYRLP